MSVPIMEKPVDPDMPFLIQGYGKTYRLTEEEFNAALQAANGLSSGARLVTTGEAAQLLGVSSKTIARLVDAGRIPAFRTSDSGHRLMKAEDVLAYKRGREQRSHILESARDLAAEMGAYDVAPVRSGKRKDPA